jgi:predicted ATP-grasp superfamily ATP-dependent carboligase
MIKSAATFVLLLMILPLNAMIVLPALLLSWLGARRSSPKPRKTILVSGGKMTKALQLARSFSRTGHRVVLVETTKYWLTGHRFSKAVDRFHTVPDPDHPDYAEALLEIVKREGVAVYVPVCSPAASHFDSLAMTTLAPVCEILHAPPDQIELLDDKFQFARTAASFGLAAPKSYRITDPQQVIDFDFSGEPRPYILKSIPYDAIRRLDLTKLPCETAEATAAFVESLPISEAKPWVMQEFIRGREYCTHGTMRDGELRVHCCCESSAFQINYENVEEPEIEAWVRRFTEGLSLTGQASLDFIKADDDGRIYAIECNPRTHSAITMFYDHPGLSAAYLDPTPMTQPARPLPTSRPTYWIYHELWRLLTETRRRERLRTILRGKDAIFDWRDPLPFLMVHHWQIPLLLLDDLRKRKGWVRIDFNIGKLVQIGGD